MSSTSSFFDTGWAHIVDINAYDHLLFVMTLCAAYRLVQWRQILIIITAFTVGHSATLVLSSLDFIPTNPTLVDTLIPLTIMATAIVNVIRHDADPGAREIKLSYCIALLFGLVHGLAFASNFKVMMFGDSIIWPLFLFNLGIEVGQLFIVALFMGALWLYDTLLKAEHFKWNLFISGAGFGIACTIMLKAVTGS